MKKFMALIAILCISIVSFAARREIHIDRLIKKGNIYYERNVRRPFTGIVISYFPNGQIKEKITFKNGKRNGLLQRFYESGFLFFEENYKNGLLHGDRREYHSNGYIKINEKFENGKRVQNRVEYDKRGIEKKIKYNNKPKIEPRKEEKFHKKEFNDPKPKLKKKLK